MKSIFDKIEQSYLIRQLPQATVFLNKRLQIIHASDSWAKEFGLDKTEIPGKSLPSLFEEVADDVKELVKDCLSGKKSITTIKRHIDSHENERWYQWQCKPWYDENENIIGTILQHDNITNRIKNELVLEKQKSLLEESSEMHQMGYWEYNALSSAMQWTSITLKIHEVGNGFKPTLDNFTDFYAEGHSKNTISMALYEAIEKFRPWNERLELITAKGRKRWVQSIGRPIVRNNEFIGLVGTIKDVTQEVENEKRSRQNEQLLKTMIDHLPINVYIKDKESRKILVNKAECDFLGVKDPEELLGKNDFDLYDTEAARADREEDLYVMKN
ncbi:MAG: PAS domain-containing protein, partial [Flavobacteriaceae bacterium]